MKRGGMWLEGTVVSQTASQVGRAKGSVWLVALTGSCRDFRPKIHCVHQPHHPDPPSPPRHGHQSWQFQKEDPAMPDSRVPGCCPTLHTSLQLRFCHKPGPRKVSGRERLKSISGRREMYIQALPPKGAKEKPQSHRICHQKHQAD